MKMFKRTIACLMSAVLAASALTSIGFAEDETKPNPATAVTPCSPSPLIVDGEKDAVYNHAEPIVSTLVEQNFEPAEGFSAVTYTAYSGTILYFYTEIVDPQVAMAEEPQSFDDAKNGERIKYNIDFTNIHNDGAQTNANKAAQIADFKGLNLNTALTDRVGMQFSPSIGEDASWNVQRVDEDAIVYAYKLTQNGYTVEVSLDTAKIHYTDGSTGAIEPGQAVGLDVYVMDKQAPSSPRNLYTWDGKNLSWDFPAYNGTILLSELSSVAVLKRVTVNGVEATIDEAAKTVAVTLPAGADSAALKIDVEAEAAKAEIASDNKTITLTAEDGTVVTYTLNVTIAKPATPQGGDKPGAPSVSTPKNGTANVGGKLTLYKNGKKVTGTKTVKVGKVSYALKNSVVQTSGKASYKVVKLGKKSYIVNKKGYIQQNKMLKVGKRRYVVAKSGVIQKAKKKYAAVKAGKKTYIVNKQGFVQTKKKTYKVGKASYKVGKNGVAKKKK